MTQRSGPLRDIAVLDCTMALAGPFGTAVLADLGANVIKVEPPTGDLSRGLPPHPEDFATPASEKRAGCDYGGYFASVNRNKRSIVLDLKDAADRDALLALCEQADAIVENMRDGVMDRLGVGFEAVRARNPRIVYACIRGFGDRRTGASPYVDRPAYDIVAQSMGGHVHITGPEGEGGVPAGASVGDIFPGTLMALGLVSAVANAKETGVGQFLDVAMYDAVLAMSETIVCNYGFDRTELGPRGAHHPNLMPFGLFRARDGQVAIAAPGPKHWAALCGIMERPDLLDDPRTRHTFVRRENQEFVEGEINAWTQTLTRAEIVERLAPHLPCGPVNRAADIFADPHVAARGMITEFELPGDNPAVSIVGSPIKFTETPAGFYRRPPLLGEHTDEVLEQFGIRRR